MERINNDWEFTPQWSEDFLRFETKAASVRLPHTVAELPLHYADSDSYQMVCGYRRTVTVPKKNREQRLFLQFDGAAHIATVYCNGTELATHRCGYTAFRVELTDQLVYGGKNQIAVRLDTTENPGIPPFGFVIDYLTYGGLYRDVWLD
jgi:beta-galactosidase